MSWFRSQNIKTRLLLLWTQCMRSRQCMMTFLTWAISSMLRSCCWEPCTDKWRLTLLTISSRALPPRLSMSLRATKNMISFTNTSRILIKAQSTTILTKLGSLKLRDMVSLRELRTSTLQTSQRKTSVMLPIVDFSSTDHLLSTTSVFWATVWESLHQKPQPLDTCLEKEFISQTCSARVTPMLQTDSEVALLHQSCFYVKSPSEIKRKCSSPNMWRSLNQGSTVCMV